ncbi:hypothetical protein L596_004393 [Steinernema carpocapsae]|uniref:Uncharacterized protein n=1 Tax=Steinernema carpocapsae TaxID=34508 RepID=A0A4U8UXA6_STECR|nr:hypothetical protein L596_004393 [Steinernema carpocapsae]
MYAKEVDFGAEEIRRKPMQSKCCSCLELQAFLREDGFNDPTFPAYLYKASAFTIEHRFSLLNQNKTIRDGDSSKRGRSRFLKRNRDQPNELLDGPTDSEHTLSRQQSSPERLPSIAPHLLRGFVP